MRKIIVFLFINCLVCLATIPNHAQEKPKPQDQKITFEMLRATLMEIDKKVEVARKRGNKLTELDTIRGLEAECAAKGPAAHQALATLGLTVAPELGNYREALRFADILEDDHASQPTTGDMLKGYKAMKALAAIEAIADANQVIMINEAHHVPQHRAFTIALLKVLRRKGFTHFAAETLSEEDGKLNSRGYPNKHTGFYTNEPVYGDLVRTALKLGYQVIPYEPQYQNAEQRERDQAGNLVARIFKDNPKARLLVHAGYSHINESGLLAGAKTMAQRFKEMTGINPFTIDQTEMSERGETKYESPLYREALRRYRLSQPTVFKNAQGQFWTLEPGRRDLTLFHPRSIYVEGRPTWLRLQGIRLPYRLPANVCKTSARCLVSVRISGESNDPVPIDQLEIKAGTKFPVLMLPRGEFVIEVQDPEGQRLQSFPIKTHRP